MHYSFGAKDVKVGVTYISISVRELNKSMEILKFSP